MSRNTVLAAGAMLTAAALAAACDDDTGAPPATTGSASSTPASTEPAPPDDGRLTIGLLLPTSGAGAQLGQSLADGARRAVVEVNLAGGLGGNEVSVVAADEGETTAEATEAARILVDADVDAVVGPASSATALAMLDELLDQNIVTCSPTATAIALDDFPDRDLFFRTAPSDSTQAVGLATLAEQTGRTTVAVAWVDDAYGRPFASAVADALQARPLLDVVADVSFPVSGPLTTSVAEVAAARPGVVIVVAGADTGWPWLTELAAASAVDPAFEPPDIIVNDALRAPMPAPTLSTIGEEFAANIQGLSPVAFHTDDALSPFYANAYDCATLLALAAEQVGPDDHRGMAAAVNALSSGGETCRTFETCRTGLTAGREIDYDGLATSFAVQIGTDGDPDRGRYDQFRFEAGIDDTERTVTVSR